MNKVICYFPHADLRCSHAGLANLAKYHKKDVDNMNKGDFMVFLNAKQTQAKILTSDSILIHLKNEGRRLSLEAISMIPTYFNGESFNYKAALKKVIERDLARKGIV